MKAARWILVAVMTVGAAGAAYACDQAKASTQQASVTSGCSAKTAANSPAQAAANCSAEAKAQCSKMAAAAGNHDCAFCDFVSEVKANAGRVKVTTVDTDHGVTVVFAAMTAGDVEVAQAVADKAYTMMSAPAHCSYTRNKMASESCDGCKKGLGAFADAEVAMEKTDSGAATTVTTKDEKQAQELHTFFASLYETADKAGE